MQSVLDFLFNLSDGLIYVLVGAVVIDYITGVCVAIYNRKLSSGIGYRGVAKKVSIFCLVSLSHMIDQFLIADGNAIQTATAAFYISNECVSIFENINDLGIALPAALESVLRYLEKYKERR